MCVERLEGVSVATGYFTNQITLDDVRSAMPEMIFYAMRTCWWTHNRDHLYKHPETGLPCGPRSSHLMQTSDVEGFLEAAEGDTGHYGKYGLMTFVAAHHLNCVVSADDLRPTSFEEWGKYNEMLDRYFVEDWVAGWKAQDPDAFMTNEEVEAEIKRCEKKFDMSSEELLRRVEAGTAPDADGIIFWKMLLKHRIDAVR